MGIRTGEEYRRGLSDGRSVWFRGKEISDVTSHPAFRGKVDAIADIFDARDCEVNDVRVACPDLDAECRASFLIPRDAIALARRRTWSEWVARSTLGLMGRSPDYLQTAI